MRGTPISGQARGSTKAAWKAKVASQYQPVPGPPTTADVSVRITYYHDGAAPVDIDNIIKPIQDALIGMAYVDDRQVADVRAVRISLADARLITNPTADLIAALATPGDFVHVVVEDGA